MLEVNSTVPVCAVNFKPIEGFPGYRVGDDGSVWSCWTRGKHHRMSDRWRQLKPGRRDKHGHLSVCLYRNGESCSRQVSHLVLHAFVGPCPEGMEACHFPDRDPANNHLWNLRWDSKSANQFDSVRHETKPRGESHPHCKITQADVERIVSLYRAEGIGPYRIGQRLGLPGGRVKSILYGEAWNHITGLSRTEAEFGRSGNTKGEDSHKSKLTNAIVEQIMNLRREEGMGATAICRRLELPMTRRAAVDHVVHGVTWNHVTGLPCRAKPRRTVTHPAASKKV